ncbi:MAG: hypothetical protein WAM05_03565 [Candidatus Binataceae bacterium]
MPSLKAPQLPGSVKLRWIAILIPEFRERRLANICDIKIGYDGPVRAAETNILAASIVYFERRYQAGRTGFMSAPATGAAATGS